MDKTTRRRPIFIFLLRSSQGHGDSGRVVPARACPYPDTGPESRGYAGAADVPPTHTPSHCNPALSGHNLRVDGRATSNCVLYPRSTASVKTILGRGYQASNPVDRTSVTARRELAHPDEDGNELNSLTRSAS